MRIEELDLLLDKLDKIESLNDNQIIAILAVITLLDDALAS
jgi:hypothetical protein